MRITKVWAENFKGRSFNQELAPVTLFAGANFVGKTARIQALMLTLCNNLPGIASNNTHIWERLGSGNTVVTGVGGVGINIERTWTKRKDIVKATSQFMGVPDDFELPSVAIFASEFFNLSAPERIRFIFSRVKSGADVQSLRNACLANLKNIKLEEHGEQAEAAIATAVEEMNHAFDVAIAQKMETQELVADIVRQFSELRRLADQNARRLEAGVASLTQVAQDAPAPNVEGKLAEARKALESANIEVGRLQAAGETIKRQLAEMKAKAVTVDEQTITAQIEDLTRAIGEAESVTKPEPFDLSKVILSEANQNELSSMAARKSLLFSKCTDSEVDETPLKDAWQMHGLSMQTQQRNAAIAENDWKKIADELAVTESETTCSKCGQSIIKLKEQVIQTLREKLVIARKTLDDSQDAFITATVAFTTADTEYSKWQQWNKSIRDAKEEYRQLEQRTLAINAEIESSAQAAWNRANSAYVTACQSITTMRQTVANLRAKMEDRGAADAAAKVPQLEADLQSAREQYKSAAEHAVSCHTQIKQLEEQSRALQRQRAEAQTRQRAVDEAARAKAESQVMHQACDLLAEMQGKMIDQAVGPLIDRCNMICEPVLERPLAYQDGEIGFAIPGGFVGTRSMSGSELSVVHCAISIALAVESPFKLLILDEFSRLDPPRQRRMVQHLCTLVKNGVLDQAVMASASDEAFNGKGEFGDLFEIVNL